MKKRRNVDNSSNAACATQDYTNTYHKTTFFIKFPRDRLYSGVGLVTGGYLRVRPPD